MTELRVHIDEFTDPLCPWAWSAEPFRRRLRWLYGDAVSWTPRMVVLAEDRREQEDKGFTPERLAESSRSIARRHRMPIDTRVRDYVPQFYLAMVFLGERLDRKQISGLALAITAAALLS